MKDLGHATQRGKKCHRADFFKRSNSPSKTKVSTDAHTKKEY